MRAATGWKWTTSLLELFINFTMVNLRLFTTRIWKKFEVFQGRNDGVKMISGTAALFIQRSTRSALELRYQVLETGTE